MKEGLTFFAGSAVTIIHAMALAIIAVATLQAFYRSVRIMLKGPTAGRDFRDAYLQYARWLVGGLTFQLAADIIESSIAPTWDEIGRLGAIAVIRTTLNYFLERDLAELERRDAESKETAARSP